MLVPALVILAVFVVLSAWSSSRARARLIRRLRAEWGDPVDRRRDMEWQQRSGRQAD